jgi:hypothetical protein
VPDGLMPVIAASATIAATIHNTVSQLMDFSGCKGHSQGGAVFAE